MTARVAVLVAAALLLIGCMGSRECKQTCWPHPVREYSQTFGIAACGCVTEGPRPIVVASPVASAAPPPVETEAAPRRTWSQGDGF